MKSRCALSMMLLALGTAPAGAQDFEKIGTPIPISPTGIPYTVPAAARGAGWTIVSPGARLGLAGSNPAFFRGQGMAEVALDALWEYQDVGSSLDFDRYESRIASMAGKIDLFRVSVGLAYQRPYSSEYRLPRYVTDQTVEEGLEVWLGGAAVEITSTLILAGSLAWQRAEVGPRSREAYQATVGLALEFESSTLALAIKSEPFGGDADELLAPFWIQLDGRVAAGPSWTVGARLGTGWWNDTRNDALRSPIDAGVGVGWQVHRLIQVLAGVHSINPRREDAAIPLAGTDYTDLLDLEQGTFLDGGIAFGVTGLQAALSVEDSHVFDAEVPGTWVSLSIQAGY